MCDREWYLDLQSWKLVLIERSVAQMAQVGSYVPAESMKLSLLDGVLTRMGGEWFIKWFNVFVKLVSSKLLMSLPVVDRHSWSRCKRRVTSSKWRRPELWWYLTSSAEALRHLTGLVHRSIFCMHRWLAC